MLLMPVPTSVFSLGTDIPYLTDILVTYATRTEKFVCFLEVARTITKNT